MQFASLCSPKIFPITSLLISINASSISFIGFGKVILLHSFKSVTRLLRSSNIFFTGSKICLLCASNSSYLSCSSSVISISSSPSTFSLFSLFKVILTFVNASSLSKSSASFGNFWTTENLGCILKTSFSFSVKSASPSIMISISSISTLSNLFLSNILRFSNSSIPAGISSILSSSVCRYFLLRCSTFFLYFFCISLFMFLASFFNILMIFFDFLESSPLPL